MPFEVVLTKAVVKRLRRVRFPQVQDGFERAIREIATDPYAPRPDQRGRWEGAFPGIPNHRHVDLPHGWRLCYFVDVRKDQPLRIVIVFLGDHREYDHKYGFRPSG